MPTLFKDCSECGVPRDAEREFYSDGQKRANGETKKRQNCVYCCRARRRKYFYNPEKREKINNRRRADYASDGDYRKAQNKKHALKALYGLTVERFNEMRKEQGYCCAVCSVHETKAVRGTLYVDHSHKTGQIRGLLCATCNSAMGLFKEDVLAMERAVKFLRSQE